MQEFNTDQQMPGGGMASMFQNLEPSQWAMLAQALSGILGGSPQGPMMGGGGMGNVTGQPVSQMPMMDMPMGGGGNGGIAPLPQGPRGPGPGHGEIAFMPWSGPPISGSGGGAMMNEGRPVQKGLVDIIDAIGSGGGSGRPAPPPRPAPKDSRSRGGVVTRYEGRGGRRPASTARGRNK